MTSRAGFSVVVLLAVAGVLVLAGAGYYWWDATSGQRIACTQEAKICPDGSAVGRTGPKCEFTACPETDGITGVECQARGGEVVNTLAGIPDYQPSEVLGEIREANCPCVCVKRNASSTAATDNQPYQGVIAEFLTQWPEIQKQVPFKPVLGATSFHVTAFEFLSPARFLVSFEDGHVAGAAVVDVAIVTMPGQNLRSFSILETVHPNNFPFTVDAWYALLTKYGGSSDLAKTFMTSVVRGTEVITFNGWVEVPENPFVWTMPAKGE